MSPITISRVGSTRSPSASCRGAFRLLAIASAALLLSGLLTVAVASPAPVAATAPLVPPATAAPPATSGDWPQYQHDATHSGYNAAEKTISTANVHALGVAWTGATDDQLYGSLAVANGVVYIGSNGDTLYAFASNGGSGCSGTPRTCDPLWTATAGGGLDSSPAVANGVVYVGANDDKLYAFDANGSTNCTVSGGRKRCTPLWTAATGEDIDFSSPAVANGVVYVGSDDDNLYAFDVKADHLGLSPAGATIIAGATQTYTATGFDIHNASLGNLTANTTFTISGGGSCTGAVCTSTVIGPQWRLRWTRCIGVVAGWMCTRRRWPRACGGSIRADESAKRSGPSARPPASC